MVKKGQEQVSEMDSPRQGQPVNPDEPKIKHTGTGSHSGRRAKLRPEGSQASRGRKAGTRMAKQGQHNDDSRDQDKSHGHNNPDKSVTITTGSYKSPATYQEQKARHEPTNKPAQADRNEWHEDTHKYPGGHGTSWHREQAGDHRSGSDSNASRRTRG